MIEPNKNITFFSSESNWLELRKEAWQEEYEYSWADVDNESLIQARCDYFFSGDLTAFINSEQKPGLIEVILSSPVQKLEDLTPKISQYCEWVTNTDITWGITNKTNLNERLFETIKSALRENSYLPLTLVAELFTYYFGERFEENREVTLTFSTGKKVFTSPMRAHELSSMLRAYITNYMYEVPEDRARNALTSKFLIEFYFSVAEDIDERNFSLFKIRELEINGVTAGPGSQRGLRYLIARMLGYITEYEAEEDDIDEWFVNDAEFEGEFKKRWNACNWPPAYYKLVEFIHKHKDECLFEYD